MKNKSENVKEGFKEFWTNLKRFVVNHKIWSTIIALFLVICAAGAFVEESESEEPTKETVTKEETKEPKKEDKEEPKEKKDEQSKTSDKPEKEQSEKEEPKTEQSKKPVTDEDKLKKSLDEEVASSDVRDVKMGNGPSDVTIELDGRNAMTKKSTARRFKMGTSEALLALKKSGVNVNSADIYVYSELTDGTEDKDTMVMSSRWSKSTIDSMDEDAIYTLPDHIETKAESSFMHPITRDE